MSGNEAVKYLGVKLSLPPLRTSCVSLTVFKYVLAVSLLGFWCLSFLVLNFAPCGTPVQTQLIVDTTTCLSRFSVDSRELTSIQITEE